MTERPTFSMQPYPNYGLEIIMLVIVLKMNRELFKMVVEEKNANRYRGSVAECLARSASDSGSGGRGFDSQPSHVVIALGKQFTLTFPSPPTCKMGTQLQAMSL